MEVQEVIMKNQKHLKMLPSPPSNEDILLARSSAEELSRFLSTMPESQRAQIKMDGQDLIFPRSALILLRDLLAEMAQGNIVSIVPTHHLLTTQEAANILNVSRPFLIRLLKEKKISFHKVGTHRRIKYQDLINYKLKQDQETHNTLDELTKQAQELDMGY